MERWVIYAFISMCFAGFTAVIAKQGLVGISAELGLTLRTLFVCLFIIAFGFTSISMSDVKSLQQHNLFLAEFVCRHDSRVLDFYFKALKMGDVATVALIDKGSVVVAILLAWLIFKEVISLRMFVGATLIITGMVVISKK